MKTVLRKYYTHSLLQGGFVNEMRSELAVARVEEIQRLGASAGAAYDVRKAYDCVPVDQLFGIICRDLPPTVAAMSTFILAPTPTITN